MKIRNPIYNEYGTIDCEIEHPVHGWIQFTASPDDNEQHGKDIFSELIDAGNITPYTAPVITPEQEAQALDMVREQQKAQLRNEKLDSMLVAEFAEINSAATKDEIKSVKIK